MGEGPHHQNVSILGIREEDHLTSIEHTEVRGAVGNDSDDGDSKASVETCGTVLGENLLEAVDETAELTLATGADVSSEAGSGEIKRVHETEGSSTGGTTGRAVTDEELECLGLGVVRVEDLLVLILAGEVEGLGGEIPNDVGGVSSPEGGEALLLDDSLEAILDSGESILGLNGRGSILHLEEELDSLDRSNDCLGDTGGYTSDHEIDEEV